MKRVHARVQAGLVALSVLGATALQAQSSPNVAPLAYEAVSIKPNRSGSLSLGGMSSAGALRGMTDRVVVDKTGDRQC